MATPHFHRLRVQDVTRETDDAVSIAFEIPPELAIAYKFNPGQYLTLRATLDGEEQRRSYSICAGPDDGELRIGVRQLDGGLFSTWINTTLRPGDALDVMTPTGRFGVTPPASTPRIHVAFAAGSGITPILSIMRTVLSREPHSSFFLFYGNRTHDSILFRSAIESLKDRYLSRLSVLHVLSREQQDVPMLNGRLDREKICKLLQAQVPAGRIDHAYLCGPAAMTEELVPLLAELGLAEDQVHVERFLATAGGRPRPRATVPTAAPPAHRALLTIDGKQREIPIAAGEAVLDAALRAGMDLPFACKGGMCSTCRARVTSGAVHMDVNYSLEPWELAAGFVLTCQAHPTTDQVAIDFDQV
jgi:ring-1,2-phenylacetyl-CoA epoxidase subunit PaaE